MTVRNTLLLATLLLFLSLESVHSWSWSSLLYHIHPPHPHPSSSSGSGSGSSSGSGSGSSSGSGSGSSGSGSGSSSSSSGRSGSGSTSTSTSSTSSTNSDPSRISSRIGGASSNFLSYIILGGVVSGIAAAAIYRTRRTSRGGVLLLDDGSVKTEVLSGVVARRMQLAVSGGVPEVLAKASKFVSAEDSVASDDISSDYSQV